MSHGYSVSLVSANKKADPKSIGVALGRFCIDRGVSVVAVSATFRVSRTAVYNWFSGFSAPSKEHIEQIERFMARPKKRK